MYEATILGNPKSRLVVLEYSKYLHCIGQSNYVFYHLQTKALKISQNIPNAYSTITERNKHLRLKSNIFPMCCGRKLSSVWNFICVFMLKLYSFSEVCHFNSSKNSNNIFFEFLSWKGVKFDDVKSNDDAIWKVF